MHASSSAQSEAAVAVGTPLLRSAGPAQALSSVSLPESLVEEALAELQSSPPRYRLAATAHMHAMLNLRLGAMLVGSPSELLRTHEHVDSRGCMLQDT